MATETDIVLVDYVKVGDGADTAAVLTLNKPDLEQNSHFVTQA